MNEQLIMQMLQEAEDKITKLETKFTHGPERAFLKTQLLSLQSQLIGIQSARMDNILDSGQNTDELSEIEYELQSQLNEFILKVDRIVNED